MPKTLSFLVLCIRWAFTGWISRLWGRLGILFGLIALLQWLVEQFTDWIVTTPNLAKLFAAIPPVYFLGAVVLIAGIRVVIAPAHLYFDEREKRQALEKSRRPSLEISLTSPAITNSVAITGATSQSLAGNRQTVITRAAMDVVALVCTNIGESKALQCRARIMSVRRFGEGGRSEQIVESVELPWNKEDSEGSLAVDLVPNERRRIWIGGVHHNGHIWIYRRLTSLPLEYQQLLGAAGTYHVLLQVDAENVPPQQVLLEIIAAAGPPHQTGIVRGAAEVRILRAGYPRIDPNMQVD